MKKNKTVDFLMNNGVIILVLILVIITGVKSPNFFTWSNWQNIISTMSFRLVIALGIAGCIITAGCDLSAGRMIGLGACISGWFLQKAGSSKLYPNLPELNPILVALIAMCVCGIFGSITGSFIAFFHVPPFISTMAMMEVIYGLNLIMTPKNLGGYIDSYKNLYKIEFLGLKLAIWLALCIAALTWFIFNMTRHGKYMYAIGGNPQAAEVAGVPVRLTLVLIYMKAAMFYGLAGFMMGAQANGASVNLGLGYEMEAIAACTIGGVSVSGGRGKVSSAFIGVAVFEILKTALRFLGADANIQWIALGIIIYFAISLDIRKYVAKK